MKRIKTLADIEKWLDTIPVCPSCEERSDLVKDGVCRSIDIPYMQKYRCKTCGKRFKIPKGE